MYLNCLNDFYLNDIFVPCVILPVHVYIRFMMLVCGRNHHYPDGGCPRCKWVVIQINIYICT